MEVEIPIKTGRGLNDRTHWAARAAVTKIHRRSTYLGVSALLRKCDPGGLAMMLLFPYVVTLTRKSAGILDDDNLQGSLKAVRDGVADALLINDNDKLVRWKYAQEKCKRGQFGVRIQIEPA